MIHFCLQYSKNAPLARKISGLGINKMFALIHLGTALKRLGTALINLGSALIWLGTALIHLGTALIHLGHPLKRLGTALNILGSALISLGSFISHLGNALIDLKIERLCTKTIWNFEGWGMKISSSFFCLKHILLFQNFEHFAVN